GRAWALPRCTQPRGAAFWSRRGRNTASRATRSGWVKDWTIAGRSTRATPRGRLRASDRRTDTNDGYRRQRGEEARTAPWRNRLPARFRAAAPVLPRLQVQRGDRRHRGVHGRDPRRAADLADPVQTGVADDLAVGGSDRRLRRPHALFP